MNKKTSVILVSCNRKNLLLQAVTSLYNTTKHLSLELILVIDGDKESVFEIENYLKDKKTDNWYYIIDYSEKRRGALASWNYGLSLSTGDFIFPSGDDQFFHGNWLDIALKAHEQKLNGYGMIAVNDKVANGNVLGTTLLFDRKFCIEVLGGVCTYPDYNYFYIDNELNERAKNKNKFYWCQESIVEHIHPGAGKRAKDTLDKEREENNFIEVDKQIFLKRKSLNFPNNFTPAIK